ncbi:hypothetical protein PHLCEN_2v1518 [Hermanssonia centrifuga]|uniref:Uncharacterized protein n=1 Tax=Hermanssonia centrifuga TaxID=98765 RepID=A0A2R6RZS7_9APHY|nr:hypothetical protein PHLCEN_2v1518 [Hermanssonia centrifuga]
MSKFSAPTVYAEQLTSHSHGLPLWFPEPEVDKGEVQIGDVGWCHEGGFVRLFNVTEHHGWHPDGLPEAFTPLVYHDRLNQMRESALEVGPITSTNVKTTKVEIHGSVQAGLPVGAGIGWKFEANKAAGAILVLKDDATKEGVLPNKTWADYMRKHHPSWFQFAKDVLTLECKPEDIILVRGWTKTTEWTVSAFQAEGRASRVAINGSISPAASVGFDVAFSHRGSWFTDHRSGPRRDPAEFLSPYRTSLPRNQCVFLAHYKIKYRKFSFLQPKIEAGAGPDQLPDQDDDGDAQIEMVPETSSFHGPLDVVLDYILQNTDVDVAITSEADITDLFDGHSWPENLAGYIRENRPEIDVDSTTKTGMLSIEAAIHRKQNRSNFEGIAEGIPEDAMDVGEEGLHDRRESIQFGNLLVGRRPPDSPLVKWPHLSLMDKSAEDMSISSVSLSPDGRLVVTGSDDKVVRVFRLEDGALHRQYDDHVDTVWTVCFAPDSRHFVSGSANGEGIIWDVEELADPRVAVLIGHTADLWVAAYSPDGSRIATGSMDHSIGIWDASDGRRLRTLLGNSANVMHVQWTPDGSRLASCSDRFAAIWDVNTGTRLFNLEGHQGAVWTLQITTDGDRLLTSSEDCTCRIWSMTTGEELVILHEHTSAVWSASFSPDGREVLSGSFDQAIVTCDSYSGEQHHVFSERPSIVNAVSYSRRGDLVAAGSAEGNVKLWDQRLGAFIAEYQGHTDRIKSLQFTYDDRDIISTSDDGTLRVWNVADALCL